MAASREEPGFQNVHADYATLKADGADIVYSDTAPNGSLKVGLAVMISADRTVRLVADGDRVRGKLLKVEPDGMCNVQDRGYCDLPGGTGADLTVGRKIVGALNGGNRGYIRSVPEAGAAYAEATADDQYRGRGEIIDSSDATKTIVDLM